MTTYANKSYLTSENLIASIKRRANIPATQDMISDNEILEFANEELFLNFIPLVYSRHEDYYLVRQEIPFRAGIVRYPIPYRSIGTKVREVAIKDSGNDIREMRRISIDEVTTSYQTGSTYVRRYYFEGDEIVIHTDPNTFNPNNESLIVFYHLRPNALVSGDRVGVITNIIPGTDPNTTQIEFNGLPSNFVVNTPIDFIKTKSPHRVLLNYDINILSTGSVGVTGYIVVNTSDIPASLVVGDRVASAGETDIVNAPSDLHVMLAQMVAERVLEAIGDQAGLASAGKKLEKMEQNSSLLLDNRSIGSPIKAKAINSTIRRSGLGRKRRRYSLN